jgi:hypothetical protein
VVGYAGRIDTAWALSLERLRDQDPAAVALLELAAFLAPESIPLRLFTGRPELLAEPLSIATDPDALADTVGALVGYSLARRSPDGFQVHRLVAAVIRHQLPPTDSRPLPSGWWRCWPPPPPATQTTRSPGPPTPSSLRTYSPPPRSETTLPRAGNWF